MADKEIIETQVTRQIIEIEYETAKRNTKRSFDDFEASVDLLESERTEKDYDWMSDIRLPEFAAHMLTQSSSESSQYFQTRDFTEVYLEDEGEASKLKADAAMECINRTLNQKHLYYYQKFMRAKITNNLGGYVYAVCNWEQELRPITTLERQVETLDIDEYGNPLTDLNIQVPARRIIDVEVPGEEIVIDRFNLNVLDSRNVFTNNKYVYNIQEKDWVIIRDEKTWEELKRDEVKMGYINLDKLKDIKPPEETDTSRETVNKDEKQEQFQRRISKPFDIIERFGTFWCKVTSRDENGEPLAVEPGIDENGESLEKAELLETIITHALSGSSKTLIRFQLTPYIDVTGKPYKPLLRGLCYIHPTKDTGLGDGQYARELQIGIDDTFNLSNDRTKLATLPTLKGKKYAVEDNTTVYFEPGHMMELEDPNDVTEFVIRDNIQGAIQQISMLTGGMDKVMGIFPPDMGKIPELASTTATAFAGTQSSSNTRMNYKSLTFEHTFLNSLYWMILQMTFQFAKPETGLKLMGKKVSDFDPDNDYTYKPLSQSIETEYSKGNKIKQLTSLISFIAPTAEINPKVPRTINFMLAKVFTLMGDEYVAFGDSLLDENASITNKTGATGTANTPASNQNQVAMTGAEEFARGAIGG